MIQLDLLSKDEHDDEVYYAFRDKKSKLYIGYDGFDTDFTRGISPIIHNYELISSFNKNLITKNHNEINDLLNLPVESKEWIQLGGFINVEIVRLEITVEGTVYTPERLLNMLKSVNIDLDFEEFKIIE